MKTGSVIMRIKAIVSGAAIALATTIGSASAADQFSTITGVEAQAMTNQEMEVVRGSGVLLTVTITPSPFIAGKAVVSKAIGDASVNGIVVAGGAVAGGVDQSAEIFIAILPSPPPPP